MYIYAGLYGVVNVMIYYNVYRSRGFVIICKYSIHSHLSVRVLRRRRGLFLAEDLGRVPLERSVAKWLGVKVGHIVVASDLLDLD